MSDADKANILVVDDRPDKHVVFRAILDELGQNLYAATSGEDALRHVLQRDFAVILLDVNMPGLDGLETAALIRSRTKSAHIPIIFITADYADEMRISKGYSLGAVDYLSSPVVPEILRSKVKVFVDLYLLAEQAKRRAEERLALAEERAARSAAERANARFAFLAQASAALSRSLEFDPTVRELMRLAVPFLADAAALTFPGEEGVEARTELAWSGALAGEPLCGESVSAVECGWWRDAIARVLGSGVSESFPGLVGCSLGQWLGQRTGRATRDPARLAAPLAGDHSAYRAREDDRGHLARSDFCRPRDRCRPGGGRLRCGQPCRHRARQCAAVPEDPRAGPAQERISRDALA